jgi:hypothetical protein
METTKHIAQKRGLPMKERKPKRQQTTGPSSRGWLCPLIQPNVRHSVLNQKLSEMADDGALPEAICERAARLLIPPRY